MENQHTKIREHRERKVTFKEKGTLSFMVITADHKCSLVQI